MDHPGRHHPGQHPGQQVGQRVGQQGPTLSQLRALAAVAETLSFREAAATLGRSQPAVSAAVAALERALGAQLVERTTRRVLLTALGEEVARRARGVLEDVESLTASAAAQADGVPAGRLRIGIIPTVAPYVLPPVAAALAGELPGVRPQISEDQTARLLEALGAGRLDVAVLALPAGVAGLVELPVYREEFLLALPAGHRLAGCHGVPHAALAELDLLLLQEGHCLRDQVLDVCRLAGARTSHPASATSLTTLTRLVAGGLGTTLLPATAAAEADSSIGLARLAAPAPGRTIGLAFRETDARRELYRQLGEVVARGCRREGLPVHLLSAA
jgi:LysR family hydrogen peroxide-inducible transcriptional activator